MTLTLLGLHSKMFDDGDLAVGLLTFGNCVLKTGVIKWPLKLYVRFFTSLAFFSKFKKRDLYVFMSLLQVFQST